MAYQSNLHNCFFLVCSFLLLPAIYYSQDSLMPSRATYYGSPDCYGTPRGACGYGEYGRTVNDGYVSGVSHLYRDGSGCGACYQVRCTKPQCTEDGVNVVVTDYGEGDRTDFILSPRAYSKMSQPDKTAELFAYGVVDVEFRRIPCQYSGYNLMYKVHEHSKQPNYLAIVFIYVSGRSDITAVELWQEDCQEWRPMRRAFGAVFDMASPLRGDINVRFQVSGTNGVNWIQPKSAIPRDWKPGATYNTEVQLGLDEPFQEDPYFRYTSSGQSEGQQHYH